MNYPTFSLPNTIQQMSALLQISRISSTVRGLGKLNYQYRYSETEALYPSPVDSFSCLIETDSGFLAWPTEENHPMK